MRLEASCKSLFEGAHIKAISKCQAPRSVRKL